MLSRSVGKQLSLLLLLAPLPAWAADGGGSAMMGGLAVLLVVCAGLIAVRRQVGLLVSSLAGAGISFYLTMEHNAAKAGGALSCTISESIDCGSVISSRYGEIAGIPTALLGVAFFLGMSALAFRRLTGKGPEVSAAMVPMVALGLCFDLFLLWVQIDMGKWCVFCMSTYVINLLLLGGAFLDAREKPLGEGIAAGLKAEGFTAVIAGLVGLVVGLLITGASSGGNPGAAVASAKPQDLGRYYSKVDGEIVIEPDDPMKGAADARFTLVEWADFECPHCGIMFPELKKVIEENKDARLYYKNYPISNSCNRFVDFEGHKHACGAAVAAICAHRQNAFWPFAEVMFKNQDYLSMEDIRFMSSQANLDKAAFETCLADPAVVAAVKSDVDGGGQAGVQGTPSIFIQGLFANKEWVRVKGGYEEITALLKAAREGAALPAPTAGQ